MSTDLLTMLMWSLFLIAAVSVTAHLHRHMGVLIVSQASIMTVAALVDVRLLKSGVNPIFSLAVAVIAGCVFGLFHLPVLLQTGAALLLVLTAISQLVLVEIWYALPQITGGSGGILLPSNVAPSALLTFFLILGIIVVYLYRNTVLPTRRFDWATLKSLGPKAGAFGVPALQLYAIGFALYGALLGAAGVAATRLLGYLTVNSFGLTWALAVVMIVLASQRQPVWGALVLSAFYCAIRVLLRQSVYASVAWSHAFEILFPLTLLISLCVNSYLPQKWRNLKKTNN